MDERLQKNVFYTFNKLQDQVKDLQKELHELKEDYDKSMAINRCHMMRIKNGERLADEYILNGKLYNDFSPEQAFDYYNQKDANYILLDVSQKGYQPPEELPEATKIPLEELAVRFKEIVNKAVPILIISEDGVKSILACELLNQLGYYNVNNISGGYKFWPAFRQKQIPQAPLEEVKKAA